MLVRNFRKKKRRLVGFSEWGDDVLWLGEPFKLCCYPVVVMKPDQALLHQSAFSKLNEYCYNYSLGCCLVFSPVSKTLAGFYQLTPIKAQKWRVTVYLVAEVYSRAGIPSVNILPLVP